MESVGSRIKLRRKIIEASQKDLAKRVGVSQASITYWESDTNEPAGGNLLALANALGVTPQWLLTGRGDTPALPSLPATSSGSPKLLRLIRSLETLEQSESLPPELVEALQKTVDAFSKRSLDDDKP